MSSGVPGSTGTTPHRTGSTRQIHYNLQQQPRYVSGVVDATYAYDGSHTGYPQRLRAGTLMAQITASKQWVPCKRTAVTPAGGATAQAIPVVDASLFKAGDTITVGSDTGKTIASVNYSTNTITVSDTAFAFANDAVVFGSGALAGSETARAVLDEIDGLDLVDPDTNAAEDRQTGRLVVDGFLIRSQVIGDLAAVEGATNHLDDIRYDSDAGQV